MGRSDCLTSAERDLNTPICLPEYLNYPLVSVNWLIQHTLHVYRPTRRVRLMAFRVLDGVNVVCFPTLPPYHSISSYLSISDLAEGEESQVGLGRMSNGNPVRSITYNLRNVIG